MSKKILLHKYNMYKIDNETVKRCHDYLTDLVKRELDDKYVVVSFPYDLEVLDEDKADRTVITIDTKYYTLLELLKVIEKATQYDQLCK